MGHTLPAPGHYTLTAIPVGAHHNARAWLSAGAFIVSCVLVRFGTPRLVAQAREVGTMSLFIRACDNSLDIVQLLTIAQEI